MLQTLFNICLRLILLLSIVVITIMCAHKLRSPASQPLLHTNSRRRCHSNAQSSVAVHHEGNPITSIRPANTPLHTPHPISIHLNFGTRQGCFATPPALMASQIDHKQSTTLLLSHTLLKLPEFWQFNVSMYSCTIEMIFSHNGITEEAPKYFALIQTSSKHQQTLTKVANILQNLSQDEP